MLLVKGLSHQNASFSTEDYQMEEDSCNLSRDTQMEENGVILVFIPNVLIMYKIAVLMD